MVFFIDLPGTEPAQSMAAIVFDICHDQFSVSDVVEAEVIHAGSKQIPKIFKLGYQVGLD